MGEVGAALDWACRIGTMQPASELVSQPIRKNRVLRVPATTFVITLSPSRFSRRDGRHFLGERGSALVDDFSQVFGLVVPGERIDPTLRLRRPLFNGGMPVFLSF